MVLRIAGEIFKNLFTVFFALRKAEYCLESAEWQLNLSNVVVKSCHIAVFFAQFEVNVLRRLERLEFLGQLWEQSELDQYFEVDILKVLQ